MILLPEGLLTDFFRSPPPGANPRLLSHLQGIFPTQGMNPGLPHCRQILYQLSHRERKKAVNFPHVPLKM